MKRYIVLKRFLALCLVMVGCILLLKRVCRKEGYFAISPRTEIGYADEQLSGLGYLLSAEIERICGLRVAHASDETSNCLIFLELTDVQPTANAGQQTDQAKAYYQLAVEQENIYLRAPSIEGIYRALSALTQLLEKQGSPTDDGKVYLPMCVIENTY